MTDAAAPTLFAMKCPDGATIRFCDDGNPGCVLLMIDAWDHETDEMIDTVFVTVNLDGALMFSAALLSRLIELNDYLDSESV